MRLKLRRALFILLILVVSAVAAARFSPAEPTACAYDCESCFNNVTEDESTKLENCNNACAAGPNTPGCYGSCWNAYNTGRCAQMRTLCPGCRQEIALACGVEN